MAQPFDWPKRMVLPEVHRPLRSETLSGTLIMEITCPGSEITEPNLNGRMLERYTAEAGLEHNISPHKLRH